MTQLKTLLERLKPEIKALMEADKGLYPNTVKRLEQQLTEECFVSDLRYCPALEIMSYYTVAFKEQPTTLWMCFED